MAPQGPFFCPTGHTSPWGLTWAVLPPLHSSLLVVTVLGDRSTSCRLLPFLLTFFGLSGSGAVFFFLDLEDLMRRKPMRRSRSKKVFKATAGSHPANFRGAMRGGYRL